MESGLTFSRYKKKGASLAIFLLAVNISRIQRFNLSNVIKWLSLNERKLRMTVS